ncbi:MAG TPA: cation transporter [Polyangia bacterium]|jgi:copper chaperone
MVKLKVKGMTCGHCEQAVSKALGAVPGVTRVVHVSREREEAVVEGQADLRALVAAVREEGYTAEVVPTA